MQALHAAQEAETRDFVPPAESFSAFDPEASSSLREPLQGSLQCCCIAILSPLPLHIAANAIQLGIIPFACHTPVTLITDASHTILMHQFDVALGNAGEASDAEEHTSGAQSLEVRPQPQQERPALRQDVGVPLEAVSNQTVGQIQKQMQGVAYHNPDLAHLRLKMWRVSEGSWHVCFQVAEKLLMR